MRDCIECGGPVETRFHYCPWCSAPQRRKLVEFFGGHAELDSGRALRVSRYLDDGHVRFSIWDGERADAALSLDEAEATRLAAFLAAAPHRNESLLETLRRSLAGL